MNENRFDVLKILPDGTKCGLQTMLFTTGLIVGISEDGLIYDRRYCYPDMSSAVSALKSWDGRGDPPGPWIKEKPSDRLGPGVLGD